MTDRSTRRRPILSLLTARLREFLREPEAIFWVYVFPLFMVVALGVAFRNRPVEAVRVAIVAGRGAESVRSRAGRMPAIQGRRWRRAGMCPPPADRASGPVDRRIEESPPRYEYRFDPTRPEASWPAVRPTIACTRGGPPRHDCNSGPGGQ